MTSIEADIDNIDQECQRQANIEKQINSKPLIVESKCVQIPFIKITFLEDMNRYGIRFINVDFCLLSYICTHMNTVQCTMEKYSFYCFKYTNRRFIRPENLAFFTCTSSGNFPQYEIFSCFICSNLDAEFFFFIKAFFLDLKAKCQTLRKMNFAQ